MSTVKRGIRTILVTALVAIIACQAALAQQYYWNNLAGMPGGSGSADGTGIAAQFSNPNSVAVDGSGNIYVADRGNHTIRKITAAGVVTTLAGSPGISGSTDGAGSAARFSNPSGIAVDAGGTVYVADSDNYTIRKVTSDGTVTTLAGNPGQYGIADGVGTAALFGYPSGIAVDGSGNIYVADSASHTIRKVTSAGVVTTVAGTAGQVGATDGIGTAAQFNQPNGVAVDGNGNLFVADTFNQTIRKIAPDGSVTTVAGNPILAGNLDGTGTRAMFNFPHSVAVAANGNLYVADSYSHTIRKVTPAGVVTTLAGIAGSSGYLDAIGTVAQFSTPSGIAADASGMLYVADRYNHAIRKVTGDWGVVTTLAGSVSQSGITNGTGSAARFRFPNGIALDPSGIMYVADTNTHSIRQVTSAGVVTTVSGSAGSSGGLANGNGTAALFNYPYSVAVTSSTSMYVADTFNNLIRQVTYNGTTWVTTTIGGLFVSGSGWGSTNGGLPGKVDGTGTSAQFSNPAGIAADSSGVLYITDTYNHTIRQMVFSGSTWTVSTVSGSAELSGTADGVGNAARFNNPFGIAVDSGSNVYVSDYANHTIRKITFSGSTWTVTTLAGSPGVSGTADGIGSAAQFNSPAGLALDSGSNIYVADSGNNTIRKVSPDGTVVTLGGAPGVANGTDGVGSVATFNAPCGIAVTASGIIYVADSGNNRISVGSSVVGSGTASLISGTGATVNGAASPNGVASTVYFQYGTSLSYGKVTATQDIGSGTDFVPVSAAISGLAGNTIYHYRLVVVNANGTFYGTDEVFTTPPTAIPSVNSAPTATGTSGFAFAGYQITASNSATTFGATGLPSGLNVNPVTGIISGTPIGSGTFSTILAATNIIGTGTKTLKISIVDIPVPTLTSGTTASGVAGSNFNYAITATPFITSYCATGLPQGIVINTVKGTISGVAPTSGTFPITIGAVNFSGTTTTTLMLTVSLPYQWNNFVGKVRTIGTADGIGSAAQFYNPYAVAMDSGSNIYIADCNNCTIRKVTPTGVVTTLAGSPRVSGSADGTGSAARFSYPIGIAVDSGSNVYVADTSNSSIRKITPAGVVTTLAGFSGSSGAVNGTGTAARFNYPRGIAVDSGSTVYVMDSGNYAIRKITTAGVVSTFAGTMGSYGSTDGTGSAARFNYAYGLAVDSAKNVYATDSGNYTVRKITSAGVVTTLAGTVGSSGGADGVGSAGRFNYPTGITVDSGTNLYVADASGNTIRKMTLSGTVWSVTTIGGTPSVSGTADGVGSDGMFSSPYGIAVNSAGHIYVADCTNYRISKGTPLGLPSITGTLTVTGSVGIPLNYAITATNSPSSYDAAGLPPGLTFNAATGLISGTPSVSGSFSSTISATNMGGADTRALTLLIRNSYTGWKTLKFTPTELSNTGISGDIASPAGDGISNLMKYALNLEPRHPASTGLPISGTTTLSGTNYLTLTYTPSPGVSDVTYVVEVSGDLQTWNSGPGFTTVVNTGSSSSITVQDTTPINSTSKRFIHLKVTKP